MVEEQMISVKCVSKDQDYYEASHEGYPDVRGYGESRDLAVYTLGRLAYAIDRGLLKFVS